MPNIRKRLMDIEYRRVKALAKCRAEAEKMKKTINTKKEKK